MKNSISITKELISSLAHQINQEVFDGRLNLSSIKFGISSNSKNAGQLHFKRHRHLLSKTETFIPISIKVSNVFIWTNSDLKNVLAHELIHLYEIQILTQKPAHGIDFHKELRRINNHFPNYNVKPRESLDKVPSEDNTPVVYFLSEDRTKLVFTSPNKAMSFLVNFAFRETFKNCTSGEILASKIPRYKISRKFRYFYPVDEQKLQILGL